MGRANILARSISFLYLGYSPGTFHEDSQVKHNNLQSAPGTSLSKKDK